MFHYIAGSDESSRRSTSEERLQEALIVVGNRLLANVAEENPEAAFRVWLHKHPRSYSNDSEVCIAEHALT